MTSKVSIPHDRLAELCRQWRIQELALFGSALRSDFSDTSDLDVLVTFDKSATWDLWDLTELHDQLQELFGRSVDLVEREALRNPWRRQEILRTCEVVYAV